MAVAHDSKRISALSVPTLPDHTHQAHKHSEYKSLLERAPSAAVRHISSDAEMPLTIMNEGLSAPDPACAAPSQSRQLTEILTARMGIDFITN